MAGMARRSARRLHGDQAPEQSQADLLAATGRRLVASHVRHHARSTASATSQPSAWTSVWHRAPHNRASRSCMVVISACWVWMMPSAKAIASG